MTTTSLRRTIRRGHALERTLPRPGAWALGLVGAIAFCGRQAVSAGEQVLEFRLVTTRTEAKALEHKPVEGQSVGVTKAFGVANFKDGRIASKDFIFSWDLNKGSGPFYGYSTYSFEDGSSITARFAGTLRSGQPMHGDYTVLSGTGAFAGAKGTGSFDAVPHKLAEGNLYSGKFTIMTP